MNELGSGIDMARKMTISEVSFELNCTSEAVKRYVRELWPDYMRKGKTTYLNESHVAVILERMKAANRRYDSSRRSSTYNNIVVGADTTRSRAARVAMQLKIIDEAHRAIEAEMQSEIDELKSDNDRLKKQLEYRMDGLETYQRIAEHAGLVLSDADDIHNTYRGWFDYD